MLLKGLGNVHVLTPLKQDGKVWLLSRYSSLQIWGVCGKQPRMDLQADQGMPLKRQWKESELK